MQFEQGGDFRPIQVGPLGLPGHPFDVDAEGLNGFARGGRIAGAVMCERRRRERETG